MAEGFLSLFGHVLVLGGIRDTRTLEAFSVMCGKWTSRDQTSSRWLDPGHVSGLADGHALHPRDQSAWRAALAAIRA